MMEKQAGLSCLVTLCRGGIINDQVMEAVARNKAYEGSAGRNELRLDLTKLILKRISVYITATTT